MRFLLALAMAFALIAPAVAEAQSPTLERIKETKKFRIGFRPAQPPMSFINADGQPSGYSIDLCLRIAAGVRSILSLPEMEVEFVSVEANTRFPALTEGAIDILCGTTTKTIGRSELVDFTSLTFVTGATLMSVKDRGINGLADLQGKRVGVVRGTTSAAALEDALLKSVIEPKILGVGTTTAGFEALKAGEIDAFAGDQVILIGLIFTSEDPTAYSLSADLFSFEPFALAIQRNDNDFRLIADAVLAQLYRGGAIDGIYNKWFGVISKTKPQVLEALYLLGATPK